MVYSGVQYENELEQRLWDEGWASFRVAGSGTVDHPSGDVIGMKAGKVRIFEVKALGSGTSTRNVSNDARQLQELEMRARDDSLMGESDIETGFAIRKKNNPIWYFAPNDTRKLNYRDDYTPMYEVLQR